jgi:nucleoid DNA-binding protein
MANDLYIRTHGDTFKLVGSHLTPDLARAEGVKLVGYGNYYLERESGTRRASKQRTKETIKSSRISASELDRLFKQL